MTYKSEQEQFWGGRFGDEYTSRNRGQRWVASNTALFARVLRNTINVSSVLELGANIGMNLLALKRLLPQAELSAVELNSMAARELRENIPSAEVYEQSILDFESDRTWDLVLTKLVLIHIDPGNLPSVYKLLHRASSRYIVVAEYYEPNPTAIEYRGHMGKLFKRDFVGDMLDLYDDLRLLDYGFIYHRDNNFPQDDMTWFLLGKGI